ncbi:hypothetical protein L2729_17355 [Shewanella gelidimarina]|uniref:hypothetical protein n=1 Tax=Shewanella gelidimarina TaxID=56813 RepID=UPI00200E054F|nr:hypothetical protein [Shewanella gelidimarina]MCL1059741.1 hypothetical protein [Shewanella gelidimarina]
MNSYEIIQRAISIEQEQTKDFIIINSVLKYCVEEKLLTKEPYLGFGSHEQLKLDLIKQLRVIHLDYIAEHIFQPDVSLSISDEIDMKTRLLLKWVARKYSEKILPFGK